MSRKWFKFGVAALLYLAMIIWIGNYWLLLGLPVIFDIYVSKLIPWGFWKKPKEGKKPKAWVEWIDAIVFALVAVYFINIFFFQNYKIPTSSLEKSLLVGDHLFVSKLSYGPRTPMTPLSFPLTQNVFPVTNTKSFFEKPQWKYRRLKGFGQVKHNDIVVFNFPAGDTVATKMPNPDYYQLIRDSGRSEVHQKKGTYGEIVYRPVDRRDNYVKRCVALPGDTLTIKAGWVYINGQPQDSIPGLQFNYRVITNGTPINSRLFEEMGIANDDLHYGNGVYYYLPLTSENLNKIKKLRNVRQIIPSQEQAKQGDPRCFPHNPNTKWNGDNFGPLWMPKKGSTVPLTLDNLSIYKRIITAYEGHQLEVRNNKIFIDGKASSSYTFEMDYYFMMGDNRHNSLDSRYWGFVPEDHIVGKPILVWLSLNKDKSFPANIRWNRFFKLVH